VSVKEDESCYEGNIEEGRGGWVKCQDCKKE